MYKIIDIATLLWRILVVFFLSTNHQIAMAFYRYSLLVFASQVYAAKWLLTMPGTIKDKIVYIEEMP